MKFIALKSRKRNWTNRTNRNLLGVSPGSMITVKFGDQTAHVGLLKAPREKLGGLKFAQEISGFPAIALDPRVLQHLGAESRAEIEVYPYGQLEAPSQPESNRQVVVTPGGMRKTAKEKLAELRVNQTLEVTESYAKSGVYAHAGQLGIRVKKVGPTTIKRIE